MLRCRNEPEETVATTNRRVLLKSRPQGEPTPTDFDIVDGPMPEPKDGEYLSRTVWMSLDPYMRGRMSEAKGYAANAKLGDVLGGGTVGQVLKSNNPKFKEGDYVAGLHRVRPFRPDGRLLEGSAGGGEGGQDQVSRRYRAGHRQGSRSIHRPAQGQELR
jgi:NADPH:quinone reductase-like Zn-dependent oxidoreductase